MGTSTVYLHPDGDASKGPTGRGGGDAGGIGGEEKPGLVSFSVQFSHPSCLSTCKSGNGEIDMCYFLTFSVTFRWVVVTDWVLFAMVSSSYPIAGFVVMLRILAFARTYFLAVTSSTLPSSHRRVRHRHRLALRVSFLRAVRGILEDGEDSGLRIDLALDVELGLVVAALWTGLEANLRGSWMEK